jgi:hypothetical protein
MVVRIAGPPHRRIILFDYIPSRTAEALKALLIGADGPFRGKLLTDGLELYDIVAEKLGILHFGCAQQYPGPGFIRSRPPFCCNSLKIGRLPARIKTQEV